MQGTIMGTIAHLVSGRLSLYQGVSLARFVTGPKMDSGMRRATIPMTTLRDGDKWTTNALAKRADLSSASLPRAGLIIPIRMVPMVDQYILTKTTYTMELTTRPSHL